MIYRKTLDCNRHGGQSKTILCDVGDRDFTSGFLNKMVNCQNGIKTSDSEILLSIFAERNNETALMKSCPKDMSRLFGFLKWLFTWDTCEPICNNKSPWVVEQLNTMIQQILSPLLQGIPGKRHRLEAGKIVYTTLQLFEKLIHLDLA